VSERPRRGTRHLRKCLRHSFAAHDPREVVRRRNRDASVRLQRLQGCLIPSADAIQSISWECQGEIADMFALSLREHGLNVFDSDCSQALTTNRIDRAVRVLAMGEKLDSVGKRHEGTPRNGVWWCDADRLCNYRITPLALPLDDEKPTLGFRSGVRAVGLSPACRLGTPGGTAGLHPSGGEMDGLIRIARGM
jgi:hypothetical protein